MFSRRFLENTYETLLKRYKLCIELQKTTQNLDTLVVLPSILQTYTQELSPKLSPQQLETIYSLRRAMISHPSASSTSSKI
jgi:hypothetical protein